MARDPDCVFCKIVGAVIPAAVVYESEALVAFLDVGPLAEGHLLVIPREHCRQLTDLPTGVCTEIGPALRRLGRAMMEVTGAEGFNVLQNNGEVAGQVVPHVHVHLIPRRSGDGLGYRWNAGKYTAGRAEELAAQYQEALAQSAK